MPEYYRILYNNEVLHSNLTEEEYFDRMMDLSNQYYKTGEPDAKQLKTEIFIGE